MVLELGLWGFRVGKLRFYGEGLSVLGIGYSGFSFGALGLRVRVAGFRL